MMKISKREKYMILFLIVLIICYLLYTFVFESLISDLQELKDEHAVVSQQYEDAINTIKQKLQYEEQLKIANYKLNEISNGYLKKINQENIIVLLNNYFNQNNIDVSAVNFSDVITEKIDESNNEDTYDYMNISIAFNSTYEDMLELIDALQNSEVNFVICNLNFLVASGNNMSGTMIINVYSVDCDNIKDYSELIWRDLIDNGFYNPFNSKISTTNEVNITNNIQYDFVMSVKPTSSDLPTLVFGKSDSKNSDTYIYDDINAVSELKIKFKCENCKYYYKSSTSKLTYPNGDNWAEFIPSTDSSINLKIYSCARNSKEDASGVNIIVDNQAQLTINVYIEEDDKTNPRVTFENKKGIVIK